MPPGDYPCWVYDPTGVNPPMFVQSDAGFVALLNAPLPSTAGPNAAVPQTAPPQPAATAVQLPVVAATAVPGGTTTTPVGARFTKAPGKTAGPAVVFVNTSPHVVGKR